MNTPTPFLNPFRPGAGHPPPYLAGREEEKRDFSKLLKQETILTNLVLTGLRGVGKTVLLETFKPIAVQGKWLWAGADLSESATVSEDSISLRLLADLSPLLSNFSIKNSAKGSSIGFGPNVAPATTPMDFHFLKGKYDQTPGLASDKLKAVLEVVWSCLKTTDIKGVVLAYDEAQNLSDQAAKDQYPLSLLLDVFQSLQKKGLPIILALTGLPTLFPKLVGARTFSERMFHIVTLGKLTPDESRKAIQVPVEKDNCPVTFTNEAVNEIVRQSGGYPYFIQFLCKDMFDSYLQQRSSGTVNPSVTVAESVRRLDSDFFAGRWNRVTDRQRQLLSVIADLPNCEEEFTVQDVAEKSKGKLEKSFTPSHINQMLVALGDCGLVYKNRHGRYCFAVPLLSGFIKRQRDETPRQPYLPSVEL